MRFATPRAGPRYCLEARAAFAAMTVSPDRRHARAINEFIVGLKRAGLWTTIDLMMGWGALHDAQAALVDWKLPSRVATAVNSPTFTVDRGYTFDGATNYIDTGFVSSSSRVASGLTNNLIGTYERTNVATASYSAGARDGTAGRTVGIGGRRNVDAMTIAAACSPVAGAVAVTDSRGFSAAQRDGSVVTAWKNGSLHETIGSPALGVAFAAQPVFVGAMNSAGSINAPRASQVAGLVITSSWTAEQHAAFHALALACLTAIGAQV